MRKRMLQSVSEMCLQSLRYLWDISFKRMVLNCELEKHPLLRRGQFCLHGFGLPIDCYGILNKSNSAGVLRNNGGRGNQLIRKRVRWSVSETHLQSLRYIWDISFERMAFELWTEETSIIETRTVLFTWIQTTQQTTTNDTPTSLHKDETRDVAVIGYSTNCRRRNRYSILNNNPAACGSAGRIASGSAGRIHPILKGLIETRLISDTQQSCQRCQWKHQSNPPGTQGIGGAIDI